MLGQCKESRYNIIVPLRHGRMLVYNGASGASAVWEPSDVEAYGRVKETHYIDPTDTRTPDLFRGGFIVANDVDELGVLHAQYDAQRFDARAMTLTVAPTLACNFGCDYCFQGRDKPSGAMSLTVQDAVVALVARVQSSITRLHVAWYGGEPLLALGVLEKLSDRISRLCSDAAISYDAMIVTNGYKLTREVAQSLCDRHVKLAQVTLDGAMEFHDQRRALLGGQATFDRILTNLICVADGTSLSLSIRINVDARNADSVSALLHKLHEVGLGGRKNVSVYFAPVEAITAGCHAIADVCMSKSEYGLLEVELTKTAYDLGLTGLPYPPRFRGICGAMKPLGFVVTPNGDLHKCWDTVHMPSRRVGTVFDVDALRSDPRAREWARWSPFDNKTCANCKILPNCAGSCAHKFINIDQTLGEAATLPCPSWKYNIKERLVLMAERSGAITCDDYESAEIATEPSELCAVTPLPIDKDARRRGIANEVSSVTTVQCTSPAIA